MAIKQGDIIKASEITMNMMVTLPSISSNYIFPLLITSGYSQFYITGHQSFMVDRVFTFVAPFNIKLTAGGNSGSFTIYQGGTYQFVKDAYGNTTLTNSAGTLLLGNQGSSFTWALA